MATSREMLHRQRNSRQALSVKCHGLAAYLNMRQCIVAALAGMHRSWRYRR